MKIEDFDLGTQARWCPGCADFNIWVTVRQALIELNIQPHELLAVYGIGCHGHMANMLKCYGFESLHGRSLPVAFGAKLANRNLNVIAVAGDGDCYGEGMSHFINTARTNADIALIVHNNMVYGLTTGQASPTSAKGYKSKVTPDGVFDVPVNPIALAISAGATFVSRAFAGNIPHLKQMIAEAIKHRGFALVDVLQPCITYNKINTYEFYYKRVYRLQDENFDTGDKMKAMEKAFEWGDRIPIGIFYREERETYEESFPQLKEKSLFEQGISNVNVDRLMEEFV
ncbi:MAG: 2-oxoacid ferredoxin oxidoreductase [Candidatus Aenigmarchaeota archaeon]|nr:2-oxoacid ferredoxin oxidoreductase [Candidatus Aenigmarchaeota archaeon]